jgi:hypothetical protein
MHHLLHLAYVYGWQSTWSNNLSAVEWLIAGVLLSWAWRKRLIPALSRAWNKYDGQRVHELRSHVSEELLSFEERIRQELAEHHDRIVGSINGNGTGTSGEH